MQVLGVLLRRNGMHDMLDEAGMPCLGDVRAERADRARLADFAHTHPVVVHQRGAFGSSLCYCLRRTLCNTLGRTSSKQEARCGPFRPPSDTSTLGCGIRHG